MKAEHEQVEQPDRQGESQEQQSPRYSKPTLQLYGCISPRLTFSPPGPPP
jgi:hypothetical protein